jgi:hypothetical protein
LGLGQPETAAPLSDKDASYPWVEQAVDDGFLKRLVVEQRLEQVGPRCFPGFGESALERFTPLALIACGQPLFQVADLTAETDFGQQAETGLKGRIEQGFEDHPACASFFL